MSEIQTTTVEKSVARAIRHCLQKIAVRLKTIRRTRSAPIEIVHSLRTETRKADAALRMLADWLPHRRQHWMRDQLRDLREVAGRVRDIDIAYQYLLQFNDRWPRESMEWIQTRALTSRQHTERSLKRRVRKLIDASFADHSRQLAHRVHWRQNSPKPAASELGVEIIRQLAEELLVELDSAQSDTTLLHKVRILARRLRYMLELLSQTRIDLPIQNACETLATVQDCLGAMNDQCTTQRLLREWISDGADVTCNPPLEDVIRNFESSTTAQMTDVISQLPETTDRIREQVRLLNLSASRAHDPDQVS